MHGLGEAYTPLDNLDAVELGRTLAGRPEPHVSIVESAIGRSEVAMLLISLLSFTPASEHQRRLQKSLVGMFSIMVREMTAVRESGGGDVRCTIVPEVVAVTPSERAALLSSLRFESASALEASGEVSASAIIAEATTHERDVIRSIGSKALAQPEPPKTFRMLHTGEVRSDCSVPTYKEGDPPDRA